jgi:hypothetical protein
MIRLNFAALLMMVFAFLLGSPRAAHAAESYDNCTGFITSVPAVITTSGTWCLKKDLNTAMTTGNAIEIQTDDVTIDCNDFKLGGLAAGVATQSYGIYGALNRHNIAVRHCNIRGFFIGAALWGEFGGGHTVEDNRFDSNTYIGLIVAGDGSIVRRNRVFDTGGTTVAASADGALGIFVQYSADVLDNTVSGVAATSGTNGNAVGISAYFNHDFGGLVGSSIKGNRVRGLSAAGTGVTAGFITHVTQRIILRNNDFVGDSSAGSTGISCYASDSHAKDNVINGFATGISVCSDDGNVIAP